MKSPVVHGTKLDSIFLLNHVKLTIKSIWNNHLWSEIQGYKPTIRIHQTHTYDKVIKYSFNHKYSFYHKNPVFFTEYSTGIVHISTVFFWGGKGILPYLTSPFLFVFVSTFVRLSNVRCIIWFGWPPPPWWIYRMHTVWIATILNLL